MADKFDLEQGILQSWSITDEIELLREAISNEGLQADAVDNFLLGLVTIYNVKFDKLFNTYCQLIQERKI